MSMEIESKSHHTIMDGKVVTFSTAFVEREGVFGPAWDAAGAFEVSASRNAVMVHNAELKSDEQAEAFIEAVKQAQIAAYRMARDDRGDYT